jgi:hypothetical protein
LCTSPQTGLSGRLVPAQPFAQQGAGFQAVGLQHMTGVGKVDQWTEFS